VRWEKNSKHESPHLMRDATHPYRWIGVVALVSPFAFVAGVAGWATIRHRRRQY